MMPYEDPMMEGARRYEELGDDQPHPDEPRRPVDFNGQLERPKPVLNATTRASSSSGIQSSRETSAACTPTSRKAARDKSKTSSSSWPVLVVSHRPVKPLPKRAVHTVISSPATASKQKDTSADLRKALEKKWMQSMDGAAPVTFVNDITDEPFPNLVPDFQYLERRYV